MGLKSSFSQNVMKVDGKKVHLSKNTYLLSDVSSSFPKWIQEHDSFNKKDFGVVIFVKKGEQAELQIDYSKLSSPFKKFIFLEEDSSLFLFENTKSSDLNVETHIFVSNRAKLYKLLCNPHKESTFKTECFLQEESRFFSFDFNMNSTHQSTKVKGVKDQHKTLLQGLNILYEKQQAQQSFETHHQGEAGYGRQRFYNILGGRSRSQIKSKVIIDAPQTDSHQMLKNLILNPYAQAQNKPELEVSNDQVKATHGSTIGQPNPLEIFYMNTRGVSKQRALEFLVQGWVVSAFNVNSEDEEISSDSIDKFLKQAQPIYPFVQQYIRETLAKP